MGNQNLFVTHFNKNIIHENMYVVGLTVFSFLLSFFIGHPQWLVGTLVNMSLIITAYKVRGVKILPVVMAPSLGVIARGLVFGPFTVFLLYMVPFIWLGNYVLVYVLGKYDYNYFVKAFLGLTFKILILIISATLLFTLDLIPLAILNAMGAMQIVTGVFGAILAFGYLKVVKV